MEQQTEQPEGKELYESYRTRPHEKPLFSFGEVVNWDELPEVAKNDWNKLARVTRETQEAKEKQQNEEAIRTGKIAPGSELIQE